MADSTERHQQLIDAVRDRCRADANVRAALMYGSFPKGEGDAYSDVEFYVFVSDSARAEFDAADWLRAIEEPIAWFENEYGTQVAIFDDLLRGEFHFVSEAEIETVRSWTPIERNAPAERMLLADRDGALGDALRAIERGSATQATAQQVYDRFLNWFLLGCNVLRRGEMARALDALGFVQRFLLQLARVDEQNLEHWLTPSRNLESELSDPALRRYAACTSDLDRAHLESAFRHSWAWSQLLIDSIGPRMAVDRRPQVVDRIRERVSEWFPG